MEEGATGLPCLREVEEIPLVVEDQLPVAKTKEDGTSLVVKTIRTPPRGSFNMHDQSQLKRMLPEDFLHH